MIKIWVTFIKNSIGGWWRCEWLSTVFVSCIGGIYLIATKNRIGELVDEYGNVILRVAYTYLNNRADAEDAVQDVFLYILEKKPNFNDKAHEKFWIIRVTINICKNKLNTFWNKNKCSIDDVAEIATYDDYNTDSNVFKAVMSLPDKYRIVIYMYYYEDYSTPEIAKLIGKSEVTVRSHLYRARKKLKDLLKEEYDFEQEWI